MPNLKVDLVNKLSTEKYYAEIELARLANEPNINYYSKVNQMQALLKKLGTINQAMLLYEQYFNAVQNNKEQQQNQTQGSNLMPGQTHGE